MKIRRLDENDPVVINDEILLVLTDDNNDEVHIAVLGGDSPESERRARLFAESETMLQALKDTVSSMNDGNNFNTPLKIGIETIINRIENER